MTGIIVSASFFLLSLVFYVHLFLKYDLPRDLYIDLKSLSAKAKLSLILGQVSAFGSVTRITKYLWDIADSQALWAAIISYAFGAIVMLIITPILRRIAFFIAERLSKFAFFQI